MELLRINGFITTIMESETVIIGTGEKVLSLGQLLNLEKGNYILNKITFSLMEFLGILKMENIWSVVNFKHICRQIFMRTTKTNALLLTQGKRKKRIPLRKTIFSKFINWAS